MDPGWLRRDQKLLKCCSLNNSRDSCQEPSIFNIIFLDSVTNNIDIIKIYHGME